MTGNLFEASRRISSQTPRVKFQRRVAEVVSVQSDYTCTVKIAGDTVNAANVRYFAHVAPRPGQLVWIDTDGADVIVSGAVAGNGGAIPFCRVRRTTTQNTVASGDAITWDNAVSDPWSMWSSTTNPSRVTVPMTGVYTLTGIITFPNNATAGIRGCDIRVNGAGGYVAARAQLVPSGWASTGGNNFLPVSTTVALDRNDYVELQLTTSVTVNVPNFGAMPHLTVTYLGPAA
jgi:hypothetical protein